jgi:hypothetical protein
MRNEGKDIRHIESFVIAGAIFAYMMKHLKNLYMNIRKNQELVPRELVKFLQ